MTDPTDRPNLRFYPWYLLQDSGILSVVWFEDALGRYGVSTIVFDLYLLVDDIDVALQTLIQHGWSTVPYDSSKFNVGFSSRAHCRLLPPNALAATNPIISLTYTPPPCPPPPTKTPPKPTTTILLPAMDWNYKLPEVTKDALAIASLFPLLPDLLDALIDSFLDCEPSMLFAHLACQVGYLYQYVAVLQETSFAKQLKYEHRQFHLDILSGMSIGTVPFAEHEREIRNALREGKYELQTCSASRANTKLFNQAEQKRLHALIHQKDSTKNR